MVFFGGGVRWCCAMSQFHSVSTHKQLSLYFPQYLTVCFITPVVLTISHHKLLGYSSIEFGYGIMSQKTVIFIFISITSITIIRNVTLTTFIGQHLLSFQSF